MASLNEVTQTLTKQEAAHLLRRCTFGPTIGQINSFTGLTPSAALDLLFTDESVPLPPLDPVSGISWVNPPIQYRAGDGAEQNLLIDYVKAWHLDVMRQSGVNIKEKLVWFLHTHLPVSRKVVESSEAIYYQNALFRYFAYDSFKDLFKKICVDNAMLRYIDGYTNIKNKPNENFAREMLELYSIGKGPQLEEGNYSNYKEDDIKAAMRVLTGWQFDTTFEYIDPETGIPTGKMRSELSSVPDKYIALDHDSSTKTFSDLFDNTVISTPEIVDGQPTVDGAISELSAMIEMIFDQKETAKFIMRKLYRSFVYHIITQEIENDIITPLADTLYNNNYNLTEPLKQLFKSEHFYDLDNVVTTDDIRGALIKTPIDISLGLLRFFNVSLPDRETDTDIFYSDFELLVSKLHEQGLDYYEPFDVAGYDPYHQVPGYNRNWITAYALAHRYRIGEILMMRSTNPDDYNFKLNIVDWIENSGYITDPSDANEIVTTLTNNLFAVEITQDRFDYFLNTVFLDTLSTMTWKFEWNSYKSSDDDGVIRERLEVLLSALIQTPEFQLC